MAAPGSPCGENMGDFDRHSSSNGHCSQDPKPKGSIFLESFTMPQFNYISIKIRTEETKPEFSEDEEMLIARMFNLVGQRWSLIAGRIPGRTAEEIEKYWSSRHGSQSQKQT